MSKVQVKLTKVWVT